MKTRTVVIVAFLASVLALSGCTFARSMTAAGHAEPASTAAATASPTLRSKVDHKVYPDCVKPRDNAGESCIMETPNGFLLRDKGHNYAITVGDDFTREGRHFFVMVTGDLSAPSLIIAAQCMDNALSPDPCFTVDQDSKVHMQSGGNEWGVVMLDAWDYGHGAYAVLVCPVEGTCPVPAT